MSNDNRKCLEIGVWVDISFGYFWFNYRILWPFSVVRPLEWSYHLYDHYKCKNFIGFLVLAMSHLSFWLPFELPCFDYDMKFNFSMQLFKLFLGLFLTYTDNNSLLMIRSMIAFDCVHYIWTLFSNQIESMNRDVVLLLLTLRKCLSNVEWCVNDEHWSEMLFVDYK